MTIPKYGRIHLCFDHGTYVQYMGFTHWFSLMIPWFEHLSSVIVYHCHQYSQYIPETGGKKSTPTRTGGRRRTTAATTTTAATAATTTTKSPSKSVQIGFITLSSC
jgi:hypothetical protein